MALADRSTPVEAPPASPPPPRRRPPSVTEFQSDPVAIEERPFPWLARAILHTVIALFLAAVIWASIAHIDRTVVAQGRIVTSEPMIVIQPLESGVIRTLDVAVGDTVRKGDRIATLDATFAAADVAGLEERIASLRAEADRLRSEMDGSPFTAPPGDRDRQFQARLREQRVAEYRHRMATYAAREAEMEDGIAASRKAQETLRDRIRVLEQITEMRGELHQRNVGSRLHLLEAQSNGLALKEQQTAKLAEEQELRHKLEATRNERAAYEREYARDTAEKLLAVTREVEGLTQSLAKAVRRNTLVDLRAPADAVVLELAQRSVGSVARDTEVLATLVPLNVPLEVEAEIRAADISRVRGGDRVRLKLDAFPFQRHGTIPGRVRVVSEDAFINEKTKEKPPVYRARVALDGTGLRDVPVDFRLIPGMTGSAEIIVGQRSIISYFLYPILRVFDESLREP